MKLFTYLNVLCVVLVIAGINGQRKCRAKKGKYFNEDEPSLGRCRRCILCPPGQEWNVKATIRTSPNRGDLECYPCIACKANFYKEMDTLRTCSPCLLKCEKLHRYLEVPCGGVKRGHCGSCEPGYQDTFLDTELPCTRPEGMYSSSTNDPNLKTAALPSSSIPWTTPKKDSLTSDCKDIILFGFCTVVVILVGVFCAYLLRKCIKRQGCGSQDAEIPVDAQNVSSTTLLVQNHRYDVVNRATRSLLERDEIDGPADGEVRAEIQRHPCDTLTTYQDETHREFPCFRLTEDDQLLALVAKNVYGGNTEILCNLLKVDRQTFFSEKELWERGRQSYKDFVLNVLITWIQRTGRNATLNVLCEALYKADCHDAVNEVNRELRNVESNDTFENNKETVEVL